MPVSGPLPEQVRTLRLLDLGVSLAEQETTPAVLLDELLALDEIRKEAVNGGSGGVDSERVRD